MKKESKGITLIALVITIIVLLILAGVTIATLTGDNGLLGKVGEAREESKKAKGAELIQLAVTGSYGMDGKIDIVGLLNKNLKAIEGLTYNDNPIDENDENKRINNLPAKVKLNGYTYNIKDNGTVNIKNENEVTISDVIGNEENYYGKYVTNYNSPWDNGIVDVEGQLGKWQIFLVDEDNIYLIASNYITRDYTKEKDDVGFYKKSGSGYSNLCGFGFNGIRDKYSDTTSKNDIEGLLACFNQKTREKYHKWLNISTNQTGDRRNVKGVAPMIDVNMWDTYVNSKFSTYAIGGPTAEMFCNSYNAVHPETNLQPVFQNIQDGYMFSIGNNEPSNSVTGLKTEQAIDEMFFKELRDNATDYYPALNGMWLSSPSNRFDGSNITICYAQYDGYVNSFGDYGPTDIGFRPLVCLKSDIHLIKQDNNDITTFELEIN